MSSKTTLLSERLSRLVKEMQRMGGDGCIIERSVDLFYYTGIKLSAGKLCVTAKEAKLCVDGRYLQVAQEKAPMRVVFDEKAAAAEFFEEHKCKTILFDGENTSYETFARWQGLLKGTLIPKSLLFKKIRVIKDAQECTAMKKSAQLLWRGFEYLLSRLEEGVTEKELCRDFEIFCLEQGGDGLAFDPIIAFGANSAMPHYTSANVSLKRGEIVLIDIGITLDHYRSDMTRIVFYKQADKELEKLYWINKEAQKAALSQCKSGNALGLLDQAARAVMQKAGVESLFVHSLGHGIGLETHEYPRLKWDHEDKDLLLEPGMVFTVEPGLYIPGKGGVRYEDTITITQEGYENFYPDAGDKIILVK